MSEEKKIDKTKEKSGDLEKPPENTVKTVRHSSTVSECTPGKKLMQDDENSR